jgi:hypothetical protein
MPAGGLLAVAAPVGIPILSCPSSEEIPHNRPRNLFRYFSGIVPLLGLSNRMSSVFVGVMALLQKSYTFPRYSPKFLYIGKQLVQNGTYRSCQLRLLIANYLFCISHRGKQALIHDLSVIRMSPDIVLTVKTTII